MTPPSGTTPEDIQRMVYDVISAANALTLPMDVWGIAEYYGITVSFYSRSQELLKRLLADSPAEIWTALEKLQGKAPGDILSTSPAFSLRRPTTNGGEYYVFLSDDLSTEQQRQAIAGELGHIQLRHHAPIGGTPDAEKEERAALFALLLLAPPAVLEGYGANTPEDIQQLTGLDEEHSRTAYDYLAEHRRGQRLAAVMADMAERAREQMSGRQWQFHCNVF